MEVSLTIFKSRELIVGRDLEITKPYLAITTLSSQAPIKT